MNLMGKIIGNRYEILEEVGNGGMAMVYKAKDHVLNRNVAVKVLKDEFTTDSDFIKRFNTEAQSAASLSHPNIVSIYDVGHEEDNNLYYIVMELVKGKTLKEIITKDGKLSWKWSVNIAIQIASALEAAHKNGIIHRDIKPHNIIITEDGVAKVTDFGIAKAVSNSTMTAFGTTIGSVHYFSPEQAKGSITDAKSDIYSLGVVMYEMVTGRVPFDADTPVSVALKHMQEEAKTPIEINDEIPQAVNDIIVKAMQKESCKRYENATEMLADLSHALKDPEGDFVIIQNKNGEYTRVIPAVKPDEKKKSFFGKHPKLKVPAILLGLILLFFMVFFGTKFALDAKKPKQVEIPNLIGKTKEEAEDTLKKLKLNFELGEEEASMEVEQGKVVSQIPPYKEGEKVDVNSTVKISLSSGPQTAEMPDLKNKKFEEVKEELEKLGLKVEKEEENSSKYDEGVIMKQDPPAKSTVKSGDKVVLKISLGVKKVTVPMVVGMDEGTAIATLTNATLKAEKKYKSNPDEKEGKILEQTPENGKEVPENSKVQITINKIEKKDKTVNLQYTLNKPKTDSETEDETKPKTASIQVIVDGNKILKEISNAKYGETINCGTLKGTGTKTIDLRVNGKTVVNKKKINLDEWNEGATIYLDN